MNIHIKIECQYTGAKSVETQRKITNMPLQLVDKYSFLIIDELFRQKISKIITDLNKTNSIDL